MIETKQFLLFCQSIAQYFHGSLGVVEEVLEFSDSEHGLEGHGVLLSHDLSFDLQSLFTEMKGFVFFSQGKVKIGEIIHGAQSFGVFDAVFLTQSVPNLDLRLFGFVESFQIPIRFRGCLEGRKRFGVFGTQRFFFGGKNSQVIPQGLFEFTP